MTKFNCSARLVSKRSDASPIWFFRWGFGIWLNRFIFTAGWDTRGPVGGVGR